MKFGKTFLVYVNVSLCLRLSLVLVIERGVSFMWSILTTEVPRCIDRSFFSLFLGHTQLYSRITLGGTLGTLTDAEDWTQVSFEGSGKVQVS